MDFNRVAALLHVVEKSLGHPKLQAITNAAMAELMKIASEFEYGKKHPAPSLEEQAKEVIDGEAQVERRI